MGSNPRGRERRSGRVRVRRERASPAKAGRARADPRSGDAEPPWAHQRIPSPGNGAFSFTAGRHGLEPARARAVKHEVPKINDLIRAQQIAQSKYRLKHRRIPPVRLTYQSNLNLVVYFCEFVAQVAVRAERRHMYASWISDACRAPSLTGNVPHERHSSPLPAVSNDPLLQHCFLTRAQSLPVLTFADFCNPPI